MPAPRTEQEEVRLQALDALRELGHDPYPAEGWPVTHRTAEVLAAYDDDRHDPERGGTEPIRAALAGRITRSG